MGWIGTKQTRAEAVREAVQSTGSGKCLEFTEVPRGVWAVWELYGGENHGKRIIAFDLIEESSPGTTYRKSMDETVGPCYYDVPPRYLDLARDFANDKYSAEWRKEVALRNAPLRGTFVHADGCSHD